MGMTDEAATLKAPKAGEVVCLNISTTAGKAAIPASFAGCICTLDVQPDTATDVRRCSIAFGTSTAVTTTFAQQSGLTGVTITIAATTGWVLSSASGPVAFEMPAPYEATHFAFDADGDGFLQIRRK